MSLSSPPSLRFGITALFEEQQQASKQDYNLKNAFFSQKVLSKPSKSVLSPARILVPGPGSWELVSGLRTGDSQESETSATRPHPHDGEKWTLRWTENISL